MSRFYRPLVRHEVLFRSRLYAAASLGCAFASADLRSPSSTRVYPFDVPHGLDSPVGRVYALDGQVLLLGVGQDANTTVNLAETSSDAEAGEAGDPPG